uniref:DNA polymerase III subunit delta n=1 Tax=Paulinella chromatophora TaxID=39717 RepID=B1X474_PAUCH|nr:DNA polymerase III subunit delta [Paulinella chromatophora]ACB42743.1 DNA polymerase III subunit delta [Paulinella chromatophora]
MDARKGAIGTKFSTSYTINDIFADLQGQTQAKILLQLALKSQRIAPAYLFSGPSGVGRTLAVLRFLEGILSGMQGNMSTRRRLAERNFPDLLWIEPTYQIQGQLILASQAGKFNIPRRTLPQIRLTQVRNAISFLSRRPLESAYSIVVIENSEMMLEGAANALLKTLEEPGSGLLILISSNPERLLATIRSRCQQIPFKRLDTNTLMEILKNKIGYRAYCNPELLELAAGSPGALFNHINQWQLISKELSYRLLNLEQSSIDVLTLARDLCNNFDCEQQLWLLDWWQWQLWNRYLSIPQQERLEKLRRQLLAHVQPGLAWELTLLEIMKI